MKEQKENRLSLEVILGAIAVSFIIGIIIFGILSTREATNKYTTYCKEKYGNSTFYTNSNNPYPDYIKICNEIGTDGNLTKHYFNTQNLE